MYEIQGEARFTERHGNTLLIVHCHAFDPETTETISSRHAALSIPMSMRAEPWERVEDYVECLLALIRSGAAEARRAARTSTSGETQTTTLT